MRYAIWSLVVAVLLGSTASLADRAPTPDERAAIEDVLRQAGYTAWDDIEFDDDETWEVDDAVGPDGIEYDLELDLEYNIVKKERD